MKRELTWRCGFYLIALIFLGCTAAMAAETDKASQAVDVRLSEYAIDMPHTLPPGPTTFTLHNVGRKSHRFKLQGPGIEADLMSAAVDPGHTGSLEVTLQPGEYKVFCPIGSHAVKGMTMTLVVAAKP